MGPDIQQEDVDALFEKLDGLKGRGCAGTFRKYSFYDQSSYL